MTSFTFYSIFSSNKVVTNLYCVLTRGGFNLGQRGMSSDSPGSNTVSIKMDEGRRFAEQCAEAVGISKNNSKILANLLVEADYAGHSGHGLNRLDRYLKDVTKGLCNGQAVPKILNETPAMAWVDGQNGLGCIVAKFCMDLAIKKAEKEGIGWICAKGSNHFGAASVYTARAIKKGMIGMCFTNTSPCMSPSRSKGAALGSNPITVGAPASNGDTFHLDMATTAVAIGKIEQAMRNKEKIPKGWAKDKEGQVTDNAEIAFNSKCMMPLGGTEKTGGYKGYGLAMMVEIFCGMLSGSQYGPNIRVWGKDARVADLGHCFIAINPKFFAPKFKDRLSCLLNYIRKVQPIDPKRPVLIPGDPERAHMATVAKTGIVQYPKTILDVSKKLSTTLKIAPLKISK